MKRRQEEVVEVKKKEAARIPFTLSALVAGALLLALATQAGAQAPRPAGAFPGQPITWVVPYTAGGAFDILPRAIAPALSRELGVPVVVQNIPGAEGYNRIFRAAPDGHTIGMVDVVGETALRLVRKQVYDITKFEYLGRINVGANLFVASPKAAFRRVEELKTAKAPIRCGGFGALSTPILQCILLADRLGFPLAVVRFSGPQEVIVGIVRGDADIGNLGTTQWLDHIAKGNAVPLLLWSDQADPRVPGVNNLRDIGLAELAVTAVQRSVAASPGTPVERVQVLAGALGNAIRSQEIQKFLVARKFETDTLVGDPFRKTVVDLFGLLQQHEPVIKKFVERGG